MSNPTSKLTPAAGWRGMPAADRWRAFLSTHGTGTESHPWMRRSVVPCGWRAHPVPASAPRT